MTNEERIRHNETNGYILVASFDGYELYKKLNEVGAYTYYSDNCSNEGSLPIFNDAIMTKEEFIAIGKSSYNLDLK